MTDSPYNPVNDRRWQLLQAWITQTQITCDKISLVSADAGTRRYFRLHTAASTVLAVDANPEFEDTQAFLDIAGRIGKTSVRVPQIYHYNLEKGFLIIEDLGNTHVQNQIAGTPACAAALYQSALRDLITLQSTAVTEALPHFDHEFIRFELSIFEDWYLQKHLQLSISADLRELLDKLYTLIITNCEAQPQTFMHRDYHCRNLMVIADTDLAVIDFQGAMLGPVTYDTGSLLKDAYHIMPAALETQLRNFHRDSLAVSVSAERYKRWYDITALQRHLKILGIFCRLNYRDSKPDYMDHLTTVANLVRSTAESYEELADFDRFFRQIARQDS